MAEQPDWQPISRLPLIGSMIDGMLQDAEISDRHRGFISDPATKDGPSSRPIARRRSLWSWLLFG